LKLLALKIRVIKTPVRRGGKSASKGQSVISNRPNFPARIITVYCYMDVISFHFPNNFHACEKKIERETDLKLPVSTTKKKKENRKRGKKK